MARTSLLVIGATKALEEPKVLNHQDFVFQHISESFASEHL